MQEVMRKPTVTQYVIWAMGRRELRSATEIWGSVSWNFAKFATPRTVTLSTVSGILNRLVRRSDVLRIKGFGPGTATVTSSPRRATRSAEVTCGGPYRPAWSSSIDEEAMWQALDDALVEALRYPAFAWGIAFRVVMDAADFPDVRRAAAALLSELRPCDCDSCLRFHEAALRGTEE